MEAVKGVISKKVLLVRTMPYDFNPDSYNVQEMGMGKAFCRQGYDFDFVTVKKKKQKSWIFYEFEDNKSRWIEVPRHRIFRTGINFELCKKDFLKQYDLVICREYNQIMSYFISKSTNNAILYSGPYWNMFMIPMVSYIYDAFITKRINKEIKIKFTKSILAKEYLENKGYTNVHSIGVALDTERFIKCKSMAKETKEIVEFMKQNNCILYVGNLDDNKNYPFLLKVYEELLKFYPSLKFVVIGKSKQSAFGKLRGKKDEDFEIDCYKKVPDKVKKGLYRVKYIENPQLKFVYPLAKAFLLPSKYEIFGMVLLEAMYLGAPVVTSRNGGSVTLLEGKDTGVIVDDFTLNKWVLAVRKYLNDDEYTKKIVVNARNLIIENYNWDTIVSNIISICDI